MRILIVGNMGYVGPGVSRHLRQSFPDAELIGVDSGLFAHCLTGAPDFPERFLNRQIFADARDIGADLLKGVDAVIYVAAVSNDPMGSRFEKVTEEINYRAGIRLAEIARDAGVKNFVFASSCSIYGAASASAKTESDSVNPLTAYARSKIAAETALGQMERNGMAITCLRFATACGMSDRLRLDLVLNDFVACALSSGDITVLSDGTPWRPLIDVKDMARAIEWAAARNPDNGGGFLVVNAGSDRWNYQVKDLAKAVASAVEGTRVSINEAAPPDKRSYKVDFTLFGKLAPNHQPLVTLEQSIQGLRDGLVSMAFKDTQFRSSPFIRLQVLDQHMRAGRLNEDLRWRDTRGQKEQRA